MGKKLKIAGAPISWGVCEAPGWGHQMGPNRVLKEMSELGLGATEFGPAGFLPAAAEERAKVLKALHMEAIGGFFPIVIHREDHEFVHALGSRRYRYEANCDQPCREGRV